MSSNYTDQNKARCPSSRFTCEACAFVMSRTAAVSGRPPKDGKQFGGNFRNYSHLWEAGAYSNASKGEKHVVRSFIERAHSGQWFAAIADSGQKHIIPWAPINGPGRSGRVMLDELQVDVPEDVSLISDMTAMLSGGATKDEIAIGSYRSATWATMGAAVAEFERAHQRLRGGAWFSLALWLAQRE